MVQDTKRTYKTRSIVTKHNRDRTTTTFYKAKILYEMFGISEYYIAKWKKAGLIPNRKLEWFSEKQIKYMQGILALIDEYKQWPSMLEKQLEQYSKDIHKRWGKIYGDKSTKKIGPKYKHASKRSGRDSES